jgi:hypothetical protein
MDQSDPLDLAVASCESVLDSDASEPARRFRGKNKNGRWKREEGTELAVIRLPLDARPDAEAHLEQLFSSMWDVKRAPRSTPTGPAPCAGRMTPRSGAVSSA